MPLTGLNLVPNFDSPWASLIPRGGRGLVNADGIKYSLTLTREQTFEIRENGYLRNDSAIENSHKKWTLFSGQPR